MSLQESDIEQNSPEVMADPTIINDNQSLESPILTNHEEEHAGIEFTAVELAVVKKLVTDRIGQVKNLIRVLEHSLEGKTALNTSNAKIELVDLDNELDYLEHDLVKKLFKDDTESNQSYDLDKYIIGFEAMRAIDIHGQPDYALDATQLAMRKEQFTGVRIFGVDLSYVNKLVSGLTRELPRDIGVLDSSLSNSTTANRTNTEETMGMLKRERNFLKQNLGERLSRLDAADTTRDM